jgi:hypothetical protein
MITKHTFNESLKRLEPVEKTCHYCGQEDFRSMEENYFVPLFKEHDRTNVVVYRSVKYKQISVGIPRCRRCFKIHVTTSVKAKYSWAVAAGVFVLAICIWGPLAMLGILPCLLIGFLGSSFMEGRLVESEGVLTKLDGAKRNETVQDLVIQGWSCNQPTA